MRQKRATVSAMLNSKHIRRRFERAAANFDQADFVHTTTRDSLLARLDPLLVDANIVMDLGAATGKATRPLQKRFRGARIISVDVAGKMLRQARARQSWFSRASFAQASARALPFATGSIDIIFANLLLPWIDNHDRVFSEIARVLRKGGVFAFSTLGPDSLLEVQRAWRQVDDTPHVIPFPDMHNLGDGLVSAGLSDPVLDVERLAVSYRSSERLFADLSAAGARNSLSERRKSLTGRSRFSAMVSALEQARTGGTLLLDLELVFGHCWGNGPKMDASNYRIDARHIPKRQK
jgi:malonyl-CoA O-methyltransferase